jgi:hypothetical protein
MRTQVFAYKGWIGIQSSTVAKGLLNDPIKPSQLGFVLDASFVDISSEALELLKKIPRSSDDVGEIDVYKNSSGRIIFSWLGGPLKMCKPENITSSNSYDPELLKSSQKEVKIDEKFIEAVDKI